jgi:hypothetical protein
LEDNFSLLLEDSAKLLLEGEQLPPDVELPPDVLAAEVVAAMGPPAERLLGAPDLLAAIHQANPIRWPLLVQEVLDYSLVLEQIEARIAVLEDSPDKSSVMPSEPVPQEGA